MDPTWVTVSMGLPGSVGAQRAALEANGIPTFVPDETMKAWDPWLTGANALDSRLQVPESELERARRVLGQDGEPKPPPTTLEQAQRMATRMAFASMWFVTAPYAFFLAPRYFALVREAGRAPEGHRYALLALVLAAVVLLCGVATSFEWILGPAH